ncbi:MAG: hypothetical protein EBQ96_06950 [Proteobacteria bacterium]|nr:hypothetical protein [Pseudomonadota bacterium]
MIRTLSLLTFAALALVLSACGLSPVYGTYADTGTQASVVAALDSVYIDVIPDRPGQKLRNTLIDRMVDTGRNTKGDAAYKLQIGGLSESIYGIGIAKDATATRSQIRLAASFTLFDTRGLKPEPVFTRSVSATSSFNTLASQYTTLVTEDDARDQTIRLLADQIMTNLELYFSNPAAFVKKPE